MTQPLGPLQQAWVDALRSGEYQQTKGTLQSPLGYCCLGVACRVAEKHGIPVNLDKEKNLQGSSLYGSQNEVFKTIKLKKEGQLIEYNDTQGKTFEYLANQLEENASRFFHEPA